MYDKYYRKVNVLASAMYDVESNFPFRDNSGRAPEEGYNVLFPEEPNAPVGGIWMSRDIFENKYKKEKVIYRYKSMDIKTKIAFLQEITSWELKVRALEENNRKLMAASHKHRFPVCKMFICNDCPITTATGGRYGCSSTPYDEGFMAARYWKYDGTDDKRKIKKVQAVVDFLRFLLWYIL